MTKEVRDNFDGQTYDADDALEFSFVDRNHEAGLVKVEGDISRAGFLDLYGKMVKKPKYQVWVRHDEEEKERTGKSGHWRKLD